MSPTLRLLVALVGGLALGTAIEASGSAPLRALVPWIEPLGTLFVNGIRMTIIPLVVTSLVVGITSAPDTRTIGRLGGRALAFMVVTIGIAAALGIIAAGPLFALLPIDPAAAESLRASAAASSAVAGRFSAVASAADTADTPGLGAFSAARAAVACSWVAVS